MKSPLPLASRNIHATAIALSLAAVLSACATTPAAPVVPAAIAVPAGNNLAFTLKGSGLLNYECRARAEAAGGAEWALVSPDAVLRKRQ